MADGAYVKLTKDQHALQNITAGELNQPIDVESVNARKCEQCGQPLPATYQPPADEDWTTGIFGCAEDSNSCWTGVLFPCVLFGRNVASMNEELSPQSACIAHAVCIEGGIALAIATTICSGIDPDTVCLVTEGLLFAWWVCGIYTGMGRQLLQKKFHLKDSPCDPCMVHCCLHWCAICQEHRELRNHLSEGIPSEATITNPPQVQEMRPSAIQDDTPSHEEHIEDEHNLQMQPIPLTP